MNAPLFSLVVNGDLHLVDKFDVVNYAGSQSRIAGYKVVVHKATDDELQDWFAPACIMCGESAPNTINGEPVCNSCARYYDGV